MAEYGINIGVNVQSQGVTRLSNQLKELIATEQKLKDLAKGAGAETDNLNKKLEKNAKQQRDNKAAALAAAQAFAKNTAQIRKSSAALASQSEHLDSYRQKVKVGSQAWNDFSRAITKTDFTASIVQLRRFNKEAEITAATFRNMAAGGGRTGTQFAKTQSLNDLLNFDFAKTNNAMRAYVQVLEETINKVDRGSTSYKQLANRIREVNREMSQAIVPTADQYGRPAGPAAPPGRRPLMQRLRQSTRFRDVATGAGFPLLFGGGPAQAIAGGLGGAAAGLGGSIAASALVAQVEAFAQETARVGQALTSTSGAFDLMSEKALFSSEEIRLHAEALMEQGDSAAAARVMTTELAKKIGQSGIKALKDFGEEASKLGKLVGVLILRFQVFISNALKPLLQLLNSALGNLDQRARFGQLAKELKGDEAFEARLKELGVKRSGRGGLTGVNDEIRKIIVSEFGLENIFVEGGQITPGAADLARDQEIRDKANKKRQKDIERSIKAVNRELESAQKAYDKIVERLDDAVRKNRDKVAFEKEYAELIERGSTPAAAKQAIELKKQLDELNRQYDIQVKKLDLEIASVQAAITKAQAEGATKEALEAQVKALEELKKKRDELEGKKAEAEGAAREAGKPKSPRERLQDAITEIRGGLNELLDPVNQIISLAQTLGDAFSESFKGIIKGSMTAREALANLFQRTADHFLDMAARMIAAQIQMQILNIGLSFFGGGGALPAEEFAKIGPGSPLGNAYGNFKGMAKGGSVSANTPYLVGEKGPELFVPGAQGNIVPNHAMGGGTSNIVVNVDAGGTQVQGDAPNASKLGEALGAAVRAELMRQKRPGGLLA